MKKTLLRGAKKQKKFAYAGFFLFMKVVVVDFLFFAFYGKIVVYRIDCLEKEIKKRR